MHKRGLGRGLGALLSATPGEDETLVEVSLDQIEANPNQPRKIFSDEALTELAASIRANGRARALRDHTYVARYAEIFTLAGLMRADG